MSTERSEQRLDRGVVESYEWRTDRIPLPDGRHGVVCYFRDIQAQLQARKAIEDSHAAANWLGALTRIACSPSSCAYSAYGKSGRRCEASNLGSAFSARCSQVTMAPRCSRASTASPPAW